MDNSNIPQDSDHKSLQPPTGSNQGSSQRTNERTYWEEQKLPTPQTPEQFYQYYQQQMNGGSVSPNSQENSQNNYIQHRDMAKNANVQNLQPTPKKKKSRGKLTLLITLLVLILAGAGAAYAYRDTLMNTLAIYTKSPQEYYAYVEKKAINDAILDMAPHLDIVKKKYAADITTDISFDRASLDSLMQSTFGVSLVDLESSMGIPIENIGLNLFVGTDGTLTSENIGLRLNQIDLITLELFMNMAKQEIFVHLPELSSAYIKQSLTTEGFSTPSYEELAEKITAERNVELLKRYSEIIINHMTHAVLEKNASVTTNSLSADCSRITLTITQEDITNAAMAVLDEARNDEYIIDLVSVFDQTSTEYQAAIDEAKANLQSSLQDLSSDDSILMEVYVNNQGNIIGRAISTSNSKAALGYTTLNKGSLDEYQIYLKEENGNTVFKADGNQTTDVAGSDGTLNVHISNPTSEALKNVSVDITYTDVRTETIGDQIFHYGSYNLSSLDLMGIQVMVDNTVENEIQHNKITLQMGASPLVTAQTSIDYLTDYTITPPPADAITFDASQFESYLATMNIEAYLTELSEKLGIDLNSLLEPYLSGMPVE